MQQKIDRKLDRPGDLELVIPWSVVVEDAHRDRDKGQRWRTASEEMVSGWRDRAPMGPYRYGTDVDALANIKRGCVAVLKLGIDAGRSPTPGPDRNSGGEKSATRTQPPFQPRPRRPMAFFVCLRSKDVHRVLLL
ncbi:hypothetical protein GWI33_021124 [Rhynchophorus ferrugineus]|uniref:Uncharacterized protein n=1 Tax=Rhynchophorus ferrugineus TaxID=354439 RepID=A0A834M542_RHYFE|nr:hypothetical protein GWI33_021124 [Rhynchophorus ferrugineus]